MSDDKGPSKSDSQPPDLNRQREELLRNFPRGAKLAEDLVMELDRMRRRITELELDNARFRARLEEDDAIRQLLERIETLETEKQELLNRNRRAQAESEQFNERFAQVESEFSNMANLFVAASQLHSSMSPRRVTRRIKEVLAQLVGAERYCMYLATPGGTELVPIASEGVGSHDLKPLRTDDSRIGEAYRTDAAVFDERADPSQGTVEAPAVVIPLSIDEKVVGVIAVFSSLAQKTSFSTIDFELFKLLGQHAALALVSASLYVQAEQRLPGLEAFLDLSV
jgi:regulator of replication initiation timing